MKRYQKTKTAPVAPVKRIEVNNSNVIIRIIVFIVFAILGVVFITLGVKSCLETKEEVIEITTTSRNPNCSSEFTFKYHVGQDGSNASAEKQALTALYTSLTEDLYITFSSYVESPNILNLYYLNHHPNEIVTIDPILYKALEKMKDNRFIFMAPLYSYYSIGCLNGVDEYDASGYDPDVNSNIVEYYDKMLGFVKDTKCISLDLLGSNQVKLNVDSSYITFNGGTENPIYVDFMYLTNAFIIDEMAENFISKKYINGVITSVDGYSVNLGGMNDGIDYNIYDYVDSSLKQIGTFSYTGKRSIVNWKNFPLYGSDDVYYFKYSNGTIATPYMSYGNYNDYLNVKNLVAYDSNLSCSDIAIKIMDVFIGKSLNDLRIQMLKLDKVKIFYLLDNTIYYFTDGSSIVISKSEAGNYEKKPI